MLDPATLLKAYAMGIFPMAEARDDPEIFWVEPRQRALLPIDGFHGSRRLMRTVAGDRFTVTRDRAFAAVLAGCADRPETWINDGIARATLALHAAGRAHSIECWQDGALVGGLYGVRLGGAFFGESMFSRQRDASKVALAWLIARLYAGGYALLDCQFMTDHLASLGATLIERDAYLVRLSAALALGEAGADPTADAPDFFALEALLSLPSSLSPGKRIAQLLGQTS